MDTISGLNAIKSVFAALGAKTSDSNYGVALLDKTSGEPKGLMGMSDLASLLGVNAKTLDASGVFVASWESNWLRLRHGNDAASVASTAIGAAIVEAGHLIIVAKSEAAKTWNDADKAGGTAYITSAYGALGDFDGKTKTATIVSTLTGAAEGLAAKYCADFVPNVNPTSDTNWAAYGCGSGKWYLPAAGELMLMWKYRSEINKVMSAIGGTQLGTGYYWSSTESSQRTAWTLRFGNGHFSTTPKTSEFTARPVCAWY